MITLDQQNEYLTLSQAAKVVPGRPHTSTVWRWMTRGVKGIKLETALIGGRRFTTRDAIWDFFNRINKASQHSAPVTTSNRDHLVELAEQQLREFGL